MSPAFFFDRNSLAVVQSEFYCPMGVSSWLSSARIQFPSVEKPWEKRQQYDVPTYYVSGEILAAALRTELPDDMVFKAIPFPVMPWSHAVERNCASPNRSVHRGNCQHFLRPVVGWGVDVPRSQSPKPIRMVFFEVFSDLVIVV